MTYRGRVQNGVVILENPSALPDGAEVEVSPTSEKNLAPTWAEVFRDIAGKAEDLPVDLARNHDHYLHGAPKR